MITIHKITENKMQFLDLLLVADEQEDMIDRYLPDGDLFSLHDGDLKSVCVVLPIENDVCELKNIATYEQYRNEYKTMLVGTGETPSSLSFYESCGFRQSHRIKNFFTDNYDHAMFEEGIQLVDMIYLAKNLQECT